MRCFILPVSTFGVVPGDELPKPEPTPAGQEHWADTLDPSLAALDELDHDPWDDRATTW